MRIAHINVTAASGAGRTAVQLCRMAYQAGHKAVFCYAREHAPTDVIGYRIGRKRNTYMHMWLARLTDRAGFFSKRATARLVEQLERFKPDLVHLHNLHGYYLHLPTLFEYLKKQDLPIVWTLHDSWAYTGHCAFYTTAQDAPPSGPVKRRRVQQHTVGCERWRTGCGRCVLKKSYPASWFFDQSARNWKEKRALFQGIRHMILTTPSQWLRDEVKESFLKDYPLYVLPDGLDLSVYQPCASSEFMHRVARAYGLDQLGERKLVLSVAAVWDERKGIDDLIELAEKLGPEYCVAAVGLDPQQIEAIPPNTVLGIRSTGNVHDLCALYTSALVCVSASREETFPMTLVEAMACGTPVVCYDATGLPEVITAETGRAVPLGDVDALAQAVRDMCNAPADSKACKNQAARYDSAERLAAFQRLYEKIYHFSPAYQSAVAQAAGKMAENDE